MSQTRASHTLVVSDIHLADTEPTHPRIPLWKKFKQPEYFIDHAFKDFLDYIHHQTAEPVELVLNGDIFDFDSVMALPNEPIFHVSWLESRRGLNPEEKKSHFKAVVILRTHEVWVNAVRDFVSKGNRVVFVIGNHDIELHWPSVQSEVRRSLGAIGPLKDKVTFADWYYVSNHDTLIEHGNQYDPYSLCTNPVNPFIEKYHEPTLRIPFGNLAGKYIVNGMGLMNPHSENSYIKGSLWEYLVFFYQYVIKTQPLLLWTWFWGALTTLWVTVTEGLHPSLTDPLSIGKRLEEVATNANSTPSVAIALRELQAHPAALNPIRLLKELWLDRAILFGLVVFASLQVYLFFNVVVKLSIWFFIIPLLILMPAFIFYARTIRSGVAESQTHAFLKVPISAKIAQVKRVIHGHTHIFKHCLVDGVEYLNTGTWSPAFYDVECTKPYGKKCFAWIHPDANNAERVSELFEWKGSGGPVRIELSSSPQSVSAESSPVGSVMSSH